MKKLSLVLNVVLLVAVGVLYFLHFSGGNKMTSSVVNQPAEVGEMGKIAYVNFDTLMLNYQYYIDLKDQLFEKKNNIEAELSTKMKSFERKVIESQDKVKKGLVTRYQAADMEKSLREEEQKLMQLKQQLEYQLMEEEQVMNRKLQHSIVDYLKEFNKKNGFSYVLSNTFGGPLLFTDSNLNVTTSVLNGINAHYQSNKEN